MRLSFKSKIASFTLGILFTLFFISAGLILAINLRGLYYQDIKSLNIEETSGYSEAEIRENYDSLIDYCSPFYKKSLKFPTLAASEQGIQHFAEVKTIFVAFYYIFGITSVLILALLLLQKKGNIYLSFKVSALTTVIVPIIVGLAVSIDFDRAFVIFHKIFFRNDYWLFDPETDPVITILPSEFFLHCALVIIGVVILGAIIQYVIYRCTTKEKTL